MAFLVLSIPGHDKDYYIIHILYEEYEGVQSRALNSSYSRSKAAMAADVYIEIYNHTPKASLIE